MNSLRALHNFYDIEVITAFHPLSKTYPVPSGRHRRRRRQLLKGARAHATAESVLPYCGKIPAISALVKELKLL